MIDGGLEFEGSPGPRAHGAHERHARSDPAHAVEGDRPVVDLVRAFQCGDCADVALGEQGRIAKRFGKRPGAAQQHIELNPGLRQLVGNTAGLDQRGRKRRAHVRNTKVVKRANHRLRSGRSVGSAQMGDRPDRIDKVLSPDRCNRHA